MSFLGWNLKGLGSKVILELRKILKEKNIEVFGIHETNLRKEKQCDILCDMAVEWSIISNLDESNPSNRDSI